MRPHVPRRLMRPSRYHLRGIGQSLIPAGATTPTASYDPFWCGREVCGPPPTTAPSPRVVAMHLAPAVTASRAPVVAAPMAPLPPLPPPPVATSAPPVILTSAAPPSLIAQELAPPPPPTSPAPPAGGGGRGVPPAASCACSWWPIVLAAAAGFGSVYLGQSHTKERKRATNFMGA
jgi:hypothetical protein